MGVPITKKYISLLVRDQLFALLNLIQLSLSLVKLFNLKGRYKAKDLYTTVTT